ncbi:MAG: lysoplasmalogenase [Bacteroidota bacterium]|nr:lysoplasmalogenase [Bacteroidota bacterium]
MAPPKRFAAFFFWTILVLHCIAIYFSRTELRGLTKLLLIPALFTGWILPARKNGYPVSNLVIMGLLFSLAGDTLLMLKGSLFFLLGMLAFMGTHICNGGYFFILIGKKLPAIKKLLPITVFLILLAGSIFLFLRPVLHEFTIPVLVYMLLISGMAFLAAATGQVNSLHKIAAAWWIPGALLFVFSDGLLAINLFWIKHSLLDIPVMISYAAAQYLLVNGFVRSAMPAENTAT